MSRAGQRRRKADDRRGRVHAARAFCSGLLCRIGGKSIFTTGPSGEIPSAREIPAAGDGNEVGRFLDFRHVGADDAGCLICKLYFQGTGHILSVPLEKVKQRKQLDAQELPLAISGIVREYSSVQRDGSDSGTREQGAAARQTRASGLNSGLGRALSCEIVFGPVPISAGINGNPWD